MISNQINFHEQVAGQLAQIERIVILGGEIADCRLQDELPGRTWWKMLKMAMQVTSPFDLMNNYGVWNDENQQARVIDNQLPYKNKLVDEWLSLNIKRVELNITQSFNGLPQVSL